MNLVDRCLFSWRNKIFSLKFTVMQSILLRRHLTRSRNIAPHGQEVGGRVECDLGGVTSSLKNRGQQASRYKQDVWYLLSIGGISRPLNLYLKLHDRLKWIIPSVLSYPQNALVICPAYFKTRPMLKQGLEAPDRGLSFQKQTTTQAIPQHFPFFTSSLKQILSEAIQLA